MEIFQPWSFRNDIGLGKAKTDLVGFQVVAVDGEIGKIDEATYEVGSSYVVVDTGPWIFGTKVVLPAGTVDSVDLTEKKVWIGRTKEEIKAAPEFDSELYQAPEYRSKLEGYYTPFYGGR